MKKKRKRRIIHHPALDLSLEIRTYQRMTKQGKKLGNLPFLHCHYHLLLIALFHRFHLDCNSHSYCGRKADHQKRQQHHMSRSTTRCLIWSIFLQLLTIEGV